MLCIALHRFFSSRTSVSIWKYTGLQWRLTCIQTVFHTQTGIQVELSYTQACRELSPTGEEVSWILQLFLYTATQELIGYRQGKPIMTPKWYKKETLNHTNIHPITRSLLYSETKQHILKAPLPTNTLPPIQGFSVWYGFQLSTRGRPHFHLYLRWKWAQPWF